MVRRYGTRVALDKPVSTHALRHACAKHMQRNGAPIRQLQEMLGHARLDTTQLDTRVTINDLREMHARFHPRERRAESDKMHQAKGELPETPCVASPGLDSQLRSSDTYSSSPRLLR